MLLMSQTAYVRTTHRIFSSLPQTVFMWVHNKDATSNIKHWVSSVLSSTSLWKTDGVRPRGLLLKLILFVYFQVCSTGWLLRKISVLKQPCELLWVITHFQGYNIATSFGVIPVVLLVKSLLQMRCCQCETSVQLKWTQARIHVPRKKALSAQILPFICSVLLLRLKSVLHTALGSSSVFPLFPACSRICPIDQDFRYM